MNPYRLLPFLLVLSCGLSNGQQAVVANFQQYTTTHGLSHDFVTGVAQDSTGYIWITTPSGLNRFNGHEFVQFHSSSDILSPASEDLKGLTWLNRYLLGIYTTGLHLVNTGTGESRNLFVPYHDRRYQYKFNKIEKAVGDVAGNIYLLTLSGFYHFDKTGTLVSRYDHYREAEVPVAHFFFGRDLLELDNNRLLIVAIDGLYLYDKNEKRLKRLQRGDCPSLAEFLDFPAHDLCLFRQQKPGHLVILKVLSDSVVYLDVAGNKKVVSHTPFPRGSSELGYRSKLVPVNDTLLYITAQHTGFYRMRVDPASGAIKISAEKYFPAYQCNALLNDKDMNLWVATNKGLFRQDEGRSRVEKALIPPVIENAHPGVGISQLFVAKDRIYAGTYRPGSLLVFDKQMHFLSEIGFDQHRKTQNRSYDIYAITESDSATLLLATEGPLFLVNKNGKGQTPLFPPPWNRSVDWSPELLHDSKGTIWISSEYVYRYQPVGSSRVDLQACKLEYSIVSPK